MIDYQWPYPNIDKEKEFILNQDNATNRELYIHIETFFSELFNTECILVPSGRSAINLLLTYYGINRSHTVFAPKWTSYCVWDIITRVANPTINPDTINDLALIVHKWGVIEKINKSYPIVIEDSVDSLITSSKTLFPNQGDFEILSLPKIIGSYIGGIIMVKDKEKGNILRSLLFEKNELATYQSKLRYSHAQQQDTGFRSWEHLEYQNTQLDYNALIDIKNNLGNFLINKTCVSHRLEKIANKNIPLHLTPGRLPPVCCVELNDNIHEGIMIRNKNFSGFADQPDFKKVGLIPLHFRASDELFNFCLNTLCKN